MRLAEQMGPVTRGPGATARQSAVKASFFDNPEEVMRNSAQSKDALRGVAASYTPYTRCNVQAANDCAAFHIQNWECNKYPHRSVPCSLFQECNIENGCFQKRLGSGSPFGRR